MVNARCCENDAGRCHDKVYHAFGGIVYEKKADSTCLPTPRVQGPAETKQVEVSIKRYNKPTGFFFIMGRFASKKDWTSPIRSAG